MALLDDPAFATPDAGYGARSIPSILHEWAVSVDHKRLGLMYIGSGLLFFVIAGLEATAMRIQLMVPGNDFVSPQVFNRLFTLHGTTMVFFVGMPIVLGFANYLVPLMIGARDMAYPRLNAFSFWMSLFGGVLLYSSLLGAEGLFGGSAAPDVGWFAYAPKRADLRSMTSAGATFCRDDVDLVAGLTIRNPTSSGLDSVSSLWGFI